MRMFLNDHFRFAADRSSSDAAHAPRLFLNGKFYAGRMNGVRRVADRLIREIDRQASERSPAASWDIRLLLPTRAWGVPDLPRMQSLPQRLGHTQFWEQCILPFAARSGTLANFANLAPALHGRKITMVHDAQFRVSPESYPLKLRIGYRLLVPLGSRSSARVLTVSDFARDSLATFGLASPEQTSVLFNGADHILETPADRRILADLQLCPGGYCAVFGSTWRYKNLQVVLQAFTDPRLAAYELVVFGKDRAEMARAGLIAPPGTRFVPAPSDGALRALLEEAHCLLCPSRTEGFGLPPVEAMLCGCPVVAAPAGAVPEICRDAICYAGLDAAGEWVEQILALAGPQRLAKIAAGRARAARFTWRAAGERLISLLQPLVERQPARRPARGP